VADLLRGLVRLLARGQRSDSGGDLRQQAIQRLRELLRERCSEAWTVQRMAAEAGLGAHRFAVLYRRWAGSSPLRELTSFRMRRAQTLLERDGVSVAKAAKACGFTDALYFSRVFRRWTGVPPSEHPRRPALRARALH
jgi:AraC-like DNA-binding protein